MRAKVLGIGFEVPEKVLTNADLEKIVDTSDEWIITRTGIKERRITDDNTASSDLALEAAWRALKDASVSPDEIDMIIVGTVTPDMAFPSTSCIVQDKLGLRKGIPAFDYSAGCTGFIYGLTIADSFIKNEQFKKILVVGVESLTKITNWEDRATCVLFGDGAGAAVVSATENNDPNRIFSTFIAADGSLGHLLDMPAGGSRMPASHETVDKKLHYLRMAGNEVFKNAVRQMEEAAREGLHRAGLEPTDVDWLIPHQANIRIMDYVAKKLHIPREQVAITINKYGNTSAASIPMAWADYYQQGKIKRGDIILMVAFGAGFTWGSVVLKW